MPPLRDAPELAARAAWLGTGEGQAKAPRREQPPAPCGPALLEPLTAREQDVVARMALVRSVDDIAADLHVSANTVKTHRRSLYRKRGGGGRRSADAVPRGRQLNLLQVAPG